MTKNELFIELAQPDDSGVSRWVCVNEFIGKYSVLRFGNGVDWARVGGQLSKKYKIEFDKSVTSGNRIDRIRLNGFNTNFIFNQSIRSDIKKEIAHNKCVMLGVNGNSINTIIEIDHKDGRKKNIDVSNLKTQRLEDFQPLCKAANDIKRQICKICKQTNRRFDAKDIVGNPYSFYMGNEEFTDELGCIGCYQYDPVAYRKESIKKLTKEAAEYMLNRLYGESE